MSKKTEMIPNNPKPCNLQTNEILDIVNTLGRVGEQLDEEDILWKGHIAPVLIAASDELLKRIKGS